MDLTESAAEGTSRDHERRRRHGGRKENQRLFAYKRTRCDRKAIPPDGERRSCSRNLPSCTFLRECRQWACLYVPNSERDVRRSGTPAASFCVPKSDKSVASPILRQVLLRVKQTYHPTTQPPNYPTSQPPNYPTTHAYRLLWRLPTYNESAP